MNEVDLRKENQNLLKKSHDRNAKKDASLSSILKKWRTYRRKQILAAYIGNMNILKNRNEDLNILLLPSTIDGFEYLYLMFDLVFYLFKQARCWYHSLNSLQNWQF